MTQRNSAAWLRYEHTVCEEFSVKYPEAAVRHDALLDGRRSGTRRQVDVLVEEFLGGQSVRTAVDAKLRGRRIDVQEVEAFLGCLRDIPVDRGIMIAASGYTRAALDRARRDEVDLDLDILTLAELQAWQCSSAIPYSGAAAFWVPAPVGWVVDVNRDLPPLAFLYGRGRTRAEAMAAWEFMYLGIWHRRPPAEDLYQLIDKEARDIKNRFPKAAIFTSDWAVRPGHRAVLRRAETLSYPTAEITGLVEFDDVILVAVLFTPLVVERRNMRKLEYVLKKAVLGKIADAA